MDLFLSSHIFFFKAKCLSFYLILYAAKCILNTLFCKPWQLLWELNHVCWKKLCK